MQDIPREFETLSSATKMTLPNIRRQAKAAGAVFAVGYHAVWGWERSYEVALFDRVLTDQEVDMLYFPSEPRGKYALGKRRAVKI
jgi:hypothetical protein